MTYTDKHIVKTYKGLFKGLSATTKKELIDALSKSIKSEEKSRDSNFFKSFGAFIPEKSAEEIIATIKTNRKFRNKKLNF